MKGYSKYKARPVTVDGIKFSSKFEGERYKILKLLERNGNIYDLGVQPEFVLLEPFDCRGIHFRAIKYRGDFIYKENGQMIVEDTKGFATAEYKIKKKLFVSKYGDEIEFREVKK